MATLDENMNLMQALGTNVSVVNGRLVFRDEHQMDSFESGLDSLFALWQPEEEEGIWGHEFTHPALFYLNDHLGYTSLRTTYSDNFYLNMDETGEPEDDVLYIPGDKFPAILNQYGEYQVGNVVYKYISEHEVLSISPVSETLIDSLRIVGGYLAHPNVVYEDFLGGVVMRTIGGQLTQGVCQIVVNQTQTKPIIISTNPYKERREFRCFVSPNGISNQSVGGVKLTWNFGDNTPVETGFTSGTNIFSDTRSHTYEPGEYNITITASCESGVAGDNCEAICSSFIQTTQLKVEITEPECQKKSAHKIEKRGYTHNGEQYSLTCETYANTFGHYRARMGTTTRFSKLDGNTYKPFKPDDRIEVAVSSPLYTLLMDFGGGLTGCTAKSYNSFVHFTKAKHMTEEWCSPAWGNDEFFGTKASTPSVLNGFSGVKHKGQYWFFSTTHTLN